MAFNKNITISIKTGTALHRQCQLPAHPLGGSADKPTVRDKEIRSNDLLAHAFVQTYIPAHKFFFFVQTDSKEHWHPDFF